MEHRKLHREVFDRRPRYGGYLKFNSETPPHINLPIAEQSSNHRAWTTPSIDNVSKNDFVLQNNDDYELDFDMMQYMLATAIKCVELIASKASDISRDHLELTEYYLTSIKNENKDDLPNVNGVLNQIFCLKKQKEIQKRLPEIGDYTYLLPCRNDTYFYQRLREKALMNCNSDHLEIRTKPTSPRNTNCNSHFRQICSESSYEEK